MSTDWSQVYRATFPVVASSQDREPPNLTDLLEPSQQELPEAPTRLICPNTGSTVPILEA